MKRQPSHETRSYALIATVRDLQRRGAVSYAGHGVERDAAGWRVYTPCFQAWYTNAWDAARAFCDLTWAER